MLANHRVIVGAALLLLSLSAARGKEWDTLIVIADEKRVEVIDNAAVFHTPKYHFSVNVGTLTDPVMPSSNAPKRRKFKIEGLDKNWVFNFYATMNLFFYFYDRGGEMVEKQYFANHGDSAGWRGTRSASALTPRRETLTVPPRAERLVVVITSAGAPHVLGTLVVANLSVSENGRAVLATAPLTLSKDDPDTPRDWVRDGLRPKMATVVTVSGTPALCLADTAPDAHTEWRLARPVAVTPGATLTVTWDEMFTIGSAYRVGKYYDLNLIPPGKYRLVIVEQNPLDSAGETESVITLTVITPLWRRPWFWCLTVSGALAAVILTTRHLVRQRLRRQLRRLRQEHAVERERLRIARNIHDDLGARLTQVSLMSGAAVQSASLDEARAGFQKISRMTRGMVDALYETVWTVDPNNDRLDALMEHLGFMVSELCEPAAINCRTTISGEPDGRAVTSELRHHISLIVKEAVHNAVKHSRATEIRADFSFHAPTLTVTIRDNGRGFNPAAAADGHGLKNMRRRAAAIGGSLSVDSADGQGAAVIFEIKL